MPLILEGLVTTVNADGSANISPMGPVLDEAIQHLLFRPYQTSTTYRNLKRHGEGVLHVSDDVELLVEAALGTPDPMPRLIAAGAVRGWILADACRWYAFRVRSIDESQPRTEIQADVVDQGRIRDFFGFNRAKHAVVEAAILATRVAFLPLEDIRNDLARLRVLVEKTGGAAEQRAFSVVENFVRKRADASSLEERVT